jgi:hypothetical protein
LVAGVDGAVFAGALGFVVAGAATAFGGGVAGDLIEQGFAAIGDAALDDFEGAAFADSGAGLPIGMNAECADLAESGGGEFSEGFEEEASDACWASRCCGRC